KCGYWNCERERGTRGSHLVRHPLTHAWCTIADGVIVDLNRVPIRSIGKQQGVDPLHVDGVARLGRTDLNMQRIKGLRDLDVLRRDAITEHQNVRSAALVLDDVRTIAGVIQVRIVAGTARQRIISGAPFEQVILYTA